MAKPSKILIYGGDGLGIEVARHLERAGHSFIVADNDEQRLQRARDHGFATARIENATDEELTAVGIGHDVNAFFCLSAEDSENVFLALSAQVLDPKLKIIAVADSPDSAHRLTAAGVSQVIDPYAISARQVYRLIESPELPGLLETVLFGEDNLHVEEIQIPPGSFLERRQLRSVRLEERYNLIVLGIVDRELSDELIFSSQSMDHQLDAGDVLVVIGPREDIATLQADLIP